MVKLSRFLAAFAPVFLLASWGIPWGFSGGGINQALSPLYKHGTAVGINTTSGSFSVTTLVVTSNITVAGVASYPVAAGSCTVTGAGTDCDVVSFAAPAGIGRLYRLDAVALMSGCASCAVFTRLSYTDPNGTTHTTQPLNCENQSSGVWATTSVNANGEWPCASVTIWPQGGTTITLQAKHSTGTGYTANVYAALTRVK